MQSGAKQREREQGVQDPINAPKLKDSSCNAVIIQTELKQGKKQRHSLMYDSQDLYEM